MYPNEKQMVGTCGTIERYNLMWFVAFVFAIMLIPPASATFTINPTYADFAFSYSYYSNGSVYPYHLQSSDSYDAIIFPPNYMIGTYINHVNNGACNKSSYQVYGIRPCNSTDLSNCQADYVTQAINSAASDDEYTFAHGYAYSGNQQYLNWYIQYCHAPVDDTVVVWSLTVKQPVNTPPVANFTASPLTGPAPLTVNFTDTSTGSPTSWSWAFGDGNISTVQNATHTYAAAGTYDVSLTAANAGGSNTTVKVGYVVVQPVGPATYTFSFTNADGFLNKTTGEWTWDTNAQNDIIYMTDYFKKDSNWNNVHWEQKFSEVWPHVTKGNFGVNPLVGEHTLNEATLHYHAGHGYSNIDGTGAFLHLLAQDSPLPDINLYPSEVEGKWGGNNKWIILSSCLAMRDQNWEKSFASIHGTHGILGYKTESTPRRNFMELFFNYAKTNTVRDAYFLTVKQLDPSTMIDSPFGKKERYTAATVFSNHTLATNDYLPGYGIGIQPDADLVDPYWDQWPPKAEGGV
jgi:PKD repeat protein